MPVQAMTSTTGIQTGQHTSSLLPFVLITLRSLVSCQGDRFEKWLARFECVTAFNQWDDERKLRNMYFALQSSATTWLRTIRLLSPNGKLSTVNCSPLAAQVNIKTLMTAHAFSSNHMNHHKSVTRGACYLPYMLRILRPYEDSAHCTAATGAALGLGPVADEK